MPHPDWLILGGGIPALVSAWQLQRRGAQVLLLDDDNPSASRAGAGILSPLPPWQAAPSVECLAAVGAAAYPDLLTQLGEDCGYRTTAMCVLPPQDDAALAAWCARGGQVRQTADGAVHLSPLGMLQPRHLLRALRRRLPRRVARVRSLRTHGDKVAAAVLPSGEEVAAAQVLLSAGAWSATLCPPPRLPIRPVRGQMLLYDDPGETLPAVRVHGASGCYLVQRADRRILAGSTLEEVGFDSGTSADGRAWLRAQAALLLPALRGRQERAHWAGLRPAAARPIIARHPRLHNLYINSGHFRYGVTMAPAAAAHLLQVAANAVTDNPYAYPLATDDGGGASHS